jgi:hypothetical protein
MMVLCLPLSRFALSVTDRRVAGPIQDGSVFICTECEADQDQFIAIQDAIWREAGAAGESTGGGITPAQS